MSTKGTGSAPAAAASPAGFAHDALGGRAAKARQRATERHGDGRLQNEEGRHQ